MRRDAPHRNSLYAAVHFMRGSWSMLKKVMKRTTQCSGSTLHELPRTLGAAEAARVKGGATAIEYGLVPAPTAVEYTGMTAPAAARSVHWYD
jgi:hypothetical protein